MKINTAYTVTLLLACATFASNAFTLLGPRTTAVVPNPARSCTFVSMQLDDSDDDNESGVVEQVGEAVKEGYDWTKKKARKGYRAVKDTVLGKDDPEDNEATQEARKEYRQYQMEDAMSVKEEQEGLDDGVDAF